MTSDNNIEYYCTNCECSFEIPCESKRFATSCPFCGGKRGLNLIAPVYDQSDLPTPEQEEMALYERSVEQVGEEAIVNMAIHAMGYLTTQLIENGLSDGEAKINELNDARARVALSLNQLDVIYGENSEEEYRRINELRIALDSPLGMQIGAVNSADAE